MRSLILFAGLVAVLPGEVGAGPLPQVSVQVQAGTEDILGPFRSPRQGPEPDRDAQYHPQPAEAEVEPRVLLKLPRVQAPRGPEQDRDPIYHPMGAGPDHGVPDGPPLRLAL
ncbi:proline-rich acidic protein 1 [Tamandua tetradactyla]|uniref:proline-rich acidic protein 1 n=1 Tax=Tamandua tetradactyla TaxID=48850 RepID=UPI00405428DD